MEKKRERSVNFTEEETQLLINTTLKFRNAVESKKTGAEGWREKQLGWEKVARIFNANSGRTFRTTKALKNKYDALKKHLKRKITDGNISNNSNNSPNKLTDYEEKLISLMKNQVDDDDLGNSEETDGDEFDETSSFRFEPNEPSSETVQDAISGVIKEEANFFNEQSVFTTYDSGHETNRDEDMQDYRMLQLQLQVDILKKEKEYKQRIWQQEIKMKELEEQFKTREYQYKLQILEMELKIKEEEYKKSVGD